MRRKALAAGEWLLLGIFAVALRVLGHWYPVQALAGLLGAALAAVAVVLIRRCQARRRMARWAATTGWTRYDPERRDWPWLGLAVSGKATVTRAWTKQVDGFPVVTGEIRWSDGAFAGAVLARSGRGIFVEVQLPLPAPPMAMRLPYEFVGDSHRLRRPDLHQAFLDDEIPPWTARDTALFTIEHHEGRTTPTLTDRAVTRALRVVHLLALGPDVGEHPT